MRWQLDDDGFLADDQGRRVDESQTMEFKESLAQGTQSEAIKAMVAFANGQGGRVFFGVKDNGRARGVHIGGNTLEQLANRIKDHTYPTLPVFVDDPFQYEGKTVLSVEVPKDIPPIIGVYLYSERPIPPDQPVDASNLQAYRRVGRTSQKGDFMRLRQPLPSDPRMRVEVTSASLDEDAPPNVFISGRAWIEQGSATAHRIVFRLDPGAYESPAEYSDLPYPSLRRSDPNMYPSFRYEGFTNAVNFRFENVEVDEFPRNFVITATYKDDWSLAWRVARQVELTFREESGGEWVAVVGRGEFTRRILEFPPKAK